MVTTTKQITENLKKEITNNIKPILNDLRKCGMTDKQLRGVVSTHFRKNIRQEYQKLSEIKSLSQIVPLVLNRMIERGEDSKAEVLFYEALGDANIPFEFHRDIGPYVADYLIDEDLVVELDGPQHKYSQAKDDVRDKFMGKLGYRVLRIPLKYFILDRQAVLNAIQEARTESN